MSGIEGWQASERVLESGGFASRQSVRSASAAVACSEEGARRLGETYWRAVAGLTRGAVRATWAADGGRLRLLGSASLLRFGAPELAWSDRDVSCRYAIEGGVLALRPGGAVTLTQVETGDGFDLGVTVEEYLPRLAARAGAPVWTGALYARGQSPFHAAVSRRYFKLLLRERSR